MKILGNRIVKYCEGQKHHEVFVCVYEGIEKHRLRSFICLPPKLLLTLTHTTKDNNNLAGDRRKIRTTTTSNHQEIQSKHRNNAKAD